MKEFSDSRIIHVEQRLTDHKYLKHGYDSPDQWVSNPLKASDISGFVDLHDAKYYKSGTKVVEFEVKITATLSDKTEEELYPNGRAVGY